MWICETCRWYAVRLTSGWMELILAGIVSKREYIFGTRDPLFVGESEYYICFGRCKPNRLKLWSLTSPKWKIIISNDFRHNESSKNVRSGLVPQYILKYCRLDEPVKLLLNAMCCPTLYAKISNFTSIRVRSVTRHIGKMTSHSYSHPFLFDHTQWHIVLNAVIKRFTVDVDDARGE